jgi:hypothetical protein
MLCAPTVHAVVRACAGSFRHSITSFTDIMSYRYLRIIRAQTFLTLEIKCKCRLAWSSHSWTSRLNFGENKHSNSSPNNVPVNVYHTTSHTHTKTDTHTLSLTLTRSLTLTHSLTLTRLPSLSHSHSLTFTLTLAHSHTHTHTHARARALYLYLYRVNSLLYTVVQTFVIWNHGCNSWRGLWRRRRSCGSWTLEINAHNSWD